MFELNGVKIGKGHKPFIIAELSANHGGDLQRAKDSIYAAMISGADPFLIVCSAPDALKNKLIPVPVFDSRVAELAFHRTVL